jgi:hypothetical protein
VFEELDKYGEIEMLSVCDNLADHLVGNVYVKFREEEDAARALAALQVRCSGGGAACGWFSTGRCRRRAPLGRGARLHAAPSLLSPASPRPPVPRRRPSSRAATTAAALWSQSSPP